MDEVVDPVVARRVVPGEAGHVLDEGERPGDHRVEVADADGDLAPVLPFDQAIGPTVATESSEEVYEAIRVTSRVEPSA